MSKAGLFINDAGGGVWVGAWNDPERQVFNGFSSWADALAFCVAATGINPLHGLPDVARRSPKRPQPQAVTGTVQASLFGEQIC